MSAGAWLAWAVVALLVGIVGGVVVVAVARARAEAPLVERRRPPVELDASRAALRHAVELALQDPRVRERMAAAGVELPPHEPRCVELTSDGRRVVISPEHRR